MGFRWRERLKVPLGRQGKSVSNRQVEEGRFVEKVLQGGRTSEGAGEETGFDDPES